MKSVICLICIAISSICHAENFFIELQANAVYNTNDHAGETATGSAKIISGYKWLYVWGSLDQSNTMDWGGQPGPEYTLGAVGVGLRVPIARYFSVYGEFGRFFFPSQDNQWHTRSDQAWEAIHYSMVNTVGSEPPQSQNGIQRDGVFDRYRSELQDSWGGELGALVWYPLGNGWSVNAHAGYRFLQAERYAKAEWNDSKEIGCWWQTHDNVDLNAWVIGMGLTFEF